MTDRFSEERTRLLELLRKDGIYYGTQEKPILSRDGSTARWMLDSLCVSMTPEGINLAGRCLLKLLEKFSGRTIATLGTIGIPLLTSCVLQSGGRYNGMLVRKEVKTYGSRKLLEGPIDKNEPVIIMDDSVSSGLTMMECRKKLEENGFRVEGGICLVRFGWYGGFARMQEQGYHMEALYDIYDDFMYHMEDEADEITNPTKCYPEIVRHKKALEEGLHPSMAARRFMEEYLASGKLLKPPKTLDRDYDSAGGIWVSIRSKQLIYIRHARSGLWHFPGEDYGPLGHDLAIASLLTAAELQKKGGDARKNLDTSAIAVTFFSAMEECTVGELDNDRYGIVVRSRERGFRMGGALPSMPGICNSWMQFQHARKKNGKLVSFEPYQLLRHDVLKVVEPGIQWQPTGTPKTTALDWYDDPEITGKITQRAFDLVQTTVRKTSPTTSPLPEDLLEGKVDSIFISVYIDGQLRGCMGAKINRLDNQIRELSGLALKDSRFAPGTGEGTGGEIERLAVTVSFLRNPLDVGQMDAEEVMKRVKIGEHALMAYQGQRSGMLLPFVATMYSLLPVNYAVEVIDKAGITRPPYNWRRFECRTWMASDSNEPLKLVGMFPETPPPEDIEAAFPLYAQLFSDYLISRQREDGALYFRYLPFKDALVERTDLPRMAHGCWVKARAGYQLENSKLQDASIKLLDYLLTKVEEPKDAGDGNGDGNEVWLTGDPNTPSSISEISFILLAICALPEERRANYREVGETIARNLWTRIDSHGKIHIFKDNSIKDEPFQDYSPGQLLLALATACASGFSEVDGTKLDRSFDYYRHRFRYKRNWGQVSWMMQAFSTWWFVTKDPAFADFVFEIGDWVLEHQDHKDGGIFNDHQADTPGYTTGLYLEGLGCAMNMAAAMGNAAKAAPLRESCYHGFRFLDRLIIQERDSALLPNPDWALGALRPGIHQGDIRTDFVQHTLSALLELMT
ncbi:MAG: AMMECR1 domain-containing protein [bacterium]|nr:AMMECR1 domain-containing protein [bacterium]